MEQKTRKDTVKRIKIISSDKLCREQANRRHLLEGKPPTHTRRLKGTADVTRSDVKRVKRLLGKAWFFKSRPRAIALLISLALKDSEKEASS